VSPFLRRKKQNPSYSLKVIGGFLLASFSVVAAAEIPSQLPAVSRSVVPVNLFDPHGKPGGGGSGVVIAKDRVVTSCLLIQKARNLEVTQRQGVFKALLQYVLPDRDLCQLRVPHLPASAIAPGSGRKVRIGQHAYAVGAGERQVPAQNEVVISSTRPYRGSQYMRLGTSLPAHFNGGGLFDEKGQLIGILSLRFIEGENFTFALPVEWLGELENQSPASPDGKVSSSGGELDWLSRAMAREKQRDWAELLKISQHQLTHDPADAAAWFSVGVASRNLKLYNQAVHAYREAIRHHAEYVEAWHNLGNTYASLKEYDHAIHAYRDALLIEPDNDNTWYELGNAYYDLKQYAYAIDAYRKALRIQAENPKAWYNLGITYDDLGLYGESSEAYQQTLRIQPENADAWFHLGVAYARLGERHKVREIYQTLRKLSPARAESYFNTYILP
jgi:cytochrome c-type biogenesis protein CcmH/NrfG